MKACFYFLVRCRQCSCYTPIKVYKLGQRITCPHCNTEFTANDPDLESAALDESMSAVAQSLDLPYDPLSCTTRPR